MHLQVVDHVAQGQAAGHTYGAVAVTVRALDVPVTRDVPNHVPGRRVQLGAHDGVIPERGPDETSPTTLPTHLITSYDYLIILL